MDTDAELVARIARAKGLRWGRKGTDRRGYWLPDGREFNPMADTDTGRGQCFSLEFEVDSLVIWCPDPQSFRSNGVLTLRGSKQAFPFTTPQERQRAACLAVCAKYNLLTDDRNPGGDRASPSSESPDP